MTKAKINKLWMRCNKKMKKFLANFRKILNPNQRKFQIFLTMNYFNNICL